MSIRVRAKNVTIMSKFVTAWGGWYPVIYRPCQRAIQWGAGFDKLFNLLYSRFQFEKAYQYLIAK